MNANKGRSRRTSIRIAATALSAALALGPAASAWAGIAPVRAPDAMAIGVRALLSRVPDVASAPDGGVLVSSLIDSLTNAGSAPTPAASHEALAGLAILRATSDPAAAKTLRNSLNATAEGKAAWSALKPWLDRMASMPAAKLQRTVKTMQRLVEGEGVLPVGELDRFFDGTETGAASEAASVAGMDGAGAPRLRPSGAGRAQARFDAPPSPMETAVADRADQTALAALEGPRPESRWPC